MVIDLPGWASLLTAGAGLVTSIATAIVLVMGVLPKIKEVRGLVDGVAHDLKEANKRADHAEGKAEGIEIERAAAPATPGAPAGTPADPLHTVVDNAPHNPVPTVPIPSGEKT